MKQSKNECIHSVYNTLLEYSNKKIGDLVCDHIKYDIIVHFMLLQIKCNNKNLLSLLLHVFKNNDYMRDIINNSMIELLIASFDNSATFFEMFKWYEEFGYNHEAITSNITTALYIQACNFPIIKSYITRIINHLNNKDAVHFRTIFFIHDEVDIIKPYFTKDKKILNRMVIRCYNYDAINTLKYIQYKNKINFYDMSWYSLSPFVFTKHMEDSKRDPFDNEKFSDIWIEYICISYHWDYLPSMINKLTPSMWKKISNHFYMGYLNPMFVMVLFQQMKLNNIPYEKLKSYNLKFVQSDYTPFLIENNVYELFANTKGLIFPNILLTNNIQESTIVSVVSLLTIFHLKRIDDLTEIIFETSLNLSKKYKQEIVYIDLLLADNQLGWDTKTIESYSNFKVLVNRIMHDADLYQELVNKYNSFLPLSMNNMPYPYQLRYINHFISLYNKIRIKKFKQEFVPIYNTLIKFKQECILKIRKETGNELNNTEFFVIPENADIYHHFENLIENSECFDYSKDHMNGFWVNELSDHKPIRNIVNNMLVKYYVPIQEIIPILYRHYEHYATEEHFFLE